MLLPYYIASMNIEHAYFDRMTSTKHLQEFAWWILSSWRSRKASLGFMTAENATLKKQKESPIFVVIGNPPYNAGQVNENDNNKNRKYPDVDPAEFPKPTQKTQRRP